MGVLAMKKTMISSAIATMLTATGLIANSAWASDREIYQRGGEGSTAIMLTLDITETMRGIRGELNDGFSDYYMCNQATNKRSHVITVNNESFNVRFCRYRTTGYGILELGEKLKDFIIPDRYKSYTDYINQTCTYRDNSSIEYICYDRLSKAKIALLSLLVGNPELGIEKLTNDKVIGLTTFSAYHQTSDKNGSFSGKVNIKPRRLDADVTLSDGTKITQRKLLIETIKTIDDISETLLQEISSALDGNRDSNAPIASAYTEAAAALMGTTTKGAGLKVIGRKDMLLQHYYYQCKGYPEGTATWNDKGECTSGWKLKESTWGLSLSTKNFPDWIRKNHPYDGSYLRNDYPVGDGYKSDENTSNYLGARFYYINDNTRDVPYSGFSYANTGTSAERNNVTYNRANIIQNQINDTNTKSCHAQGIYMLTGGTPYIKNNDGSTYSPIIGMERMMQRALASPNSTLNTDFSCISKADTETEQDVSSRLVDYSRTGVGLLKDNTMWSCISNFAEALKDPNKNPTNLEIKTAIAGMGRYFSDLPDTKGVDLESATAVDDYFNQVNNTSFSKRFLELKDESEKHNIRNTAKLGALGGGGFYSALSVNEIAESFNSFVNVISKDIPSASVNKSVIPVDVLNPYELQPYAYLTMYEPSVQGAVSVWAGNLKRYNIGNKGWVVDSSGNNAFAANGLIKDSVKDLWEKSTLTDSEKLKARIFQGGALNKLELGKDENKDFKRTIYTTRDCKEQADKTVSDCDSSANLELKKVNTNYFDKNASSSKDPLRGYLLALLGYDVPNPDNINDEQILNIGQQRPELRQMGAILHSDPILLTQQGQVVRDGESIVTKDRHDYVLFGTTQGLLHVLDAKTGKEKLAFVPNEMVEKNHKAFVNPDAASASGQFLYGIDGPWTVHTEYVAANKDDQTLTVGKGAGEGIVGKQWVYGGLRMGGRSYYALDLTDLKNPKVKFHIDPSTATVYTPTKTTKYTPLNAMGQSWSKPVITRVNWQGTDKLVMIVGGGYDDAGANEGYEYPTYAQATEDRRGAGVYMFDADNGDLLWWASSNVNNLSQDHGDNDGITLNEQGTIGHHVENMGYSVVSTIKTVDRDGDKLTDHLYFGDLGGQVWRVDFNNFRNAEQPFATHIVRLLNETSSEAGKQPRFYVQPTFSIYRTPGSGRVMAAISIGSGNASSPLHDSNNEANWKPNAVYTLFDKDVTRSNLYSLTTSQLKQDLVPQALTATQRNGVATNTIDASQDGWKYVFSENSFYLDSNQTTGQKFYSTPMGAKVITDPVLMNNQLFVSVFDGAKSGTVQGCDAGIKGESVIERFCMPFGACGSNSGIHNSLYAGVGIAPINLSSAGQGAANSRTIINSQCEGDHCAVGNIGSDVHSDNQLNRKLRPMRWFERE